MLAKVLSAALVGIDAHLIDVEVDIAGGLPQFSVVGLPDATVRESRDRVRSALKNTGFPFSRAKKITVNLAPAESRKKAQASIWPLPLAFSSRKKSFRHRIYEAVSVSVNCRWTATSRRLPGALSIGLACRP